MNSLHPFGGRRLFVPEVIQSSAMDCGPASLKCLMEGFGIPVSYGRLREACQTDVDGTSIDTLEEVAIQLGLQAEQIMIPADHLFVLEANALPAIVVTRLPNGNTHFVVIWRAWGHWIQVMDPATGRRWQTRKNVLDELYIHAMPVPAAAWREWAGTDEFLLPLRGRLQQLGLTKRDMADLIEDALATDGWQAIATLDAATRMLSVIVDAVGLHQKRTITSLLTELYEQGKGGSAGLDGPIPPSYWSVQSIATSPDDEPMLRLRGAVLVRAVAIQPVTKSAETETQALTEEVQALSPELMAALAETPVNPGLELARMLAADGLLAPLSLLVALLLAALGITLEALLFRGIIGLSGHLLRVEQRYILFGAILLLLIANLFVERLAVTSILRMGRRLEVRLRMAFLEKMPRLGDRYFQSRLMSDMAERSHSIHRLRVLPALGSGLVRAFFTLLFTTVGLLWLHPQGGLIILSAAASALALPLIAQPILAERDLRVRSHIGALSRFYLDSLLGLVPIRVHHAAQAVRREYENLLIEWVHAGWRFYRTVVATEGLQTFVGFGLTIWLLFDYTLIAYGRDGPPTATLLLVYWALNLPLIGQEIAQLARQYPAQRNITLRLFEPLTAPQGEDVVSEAEDTDAEDIVTSTTPRVNQLDQHEGISIQLNNVSVRAGGHEILSAINLQIAPNEHIAIVGASGAGKSSLVGLLLGWHRAAAGSIWIDGNALNAHELTKLRQTTAWVDPSVQLWNRSLLENLRYGDHDHRSTAIGNGH